MSGRCREGLQFGGGLRAAATLTAAAGCAALVGAIASEVVPVWALLATGVLLLSGFARHVVGTQTRPAR